jgi:hypothetical protein
VQGVWWCAYIMLVRVMVCVGFMFMFEFVWGLELGYGTFVSTLGLVSFWLKLGRAGLLWAGDWSVLCWFGLVVFGLGTRMVENEITSESAYMQH